MAGYIQQCQLGLNVILNEFGAASTFWDGERWFSIGISVELNIFGNSALKSYLMSLQQQEKPYSIFKNKVKVVNLLWVSLCDHDMLFELDVRINMRTFIPIENC